MTDSITDLFFAMDRDLRFTYWNKALEEIAGIRAQDAIGKSIYDLFPHVRGTDIESLYNDTLKKQQPGNLFTESYLGNELKSFEIHTYPSKRGLSVLSRDVTQHVREKKDEDFIKDEANKIRRMEAISTLAGGMGTSVSTTPFPRSPAILI